MLNKLVDHRDTSVYVKHPEDYVCCVTCKGTRTLRVDLYSRHKEEISNHRPGGNASIGVVNHGLLSAWHYVPCTACNGIGYWKHNQ